MSTKETIEAATRRMEAWAADPAHGYDQQWRWGERGDYDCSSAVITAWEQAGVPVKTRGATYTGNMYAAFLACGFRDVTALVNRQTGDGLQRGDVLLNRARHTAMYCGGGREVEASINERGSATGGVPGDQTGSEFLVRSYRNYPWDCVLRFFGTEKQDAKAEAVESSPVFESNIAPNCTVSLPQLSEGCEGEAVRSMQDLLILRGHSCGGAYSSVYRRELPDGDFGPQTRQAVVDYQRAAGLDPDGICGPATWATLILGGENLD